MNKIFSLIKQKYKDGLLFSYVFQVINFLYVFFLILIFNYFNKKYEYGQYILLVSSVGFISNFVGFNSGESTIYFLSKKKISQFEVIKLGFLIDFLIGIILCSIIFLLSNFIAIELFKFKNSNLIVLYSFSVFFLILRNTIYGFWQFKENFNRFNVIKVIEISLKWLIIILLAIFEKFTLLNVVLMEVVVSCFMFLLISIIFIKERMHIINNDFNIKDKEILNKKDFFSYTLKLFTSQSLKAGNKKIDNIILGWLMSPLEVSFYDVIKKLFVPINILIQPLRQIYFPKIVKSFNDNRIKEVNKLIIYNSKVLLLISVAFIILLISFKDFLYDLFELESNYNLNFMFFSYVIVSMYLPLFWWVRILSNSVNPMYSLYSNGISTIIICGVSIPMISYFGLIGLGISLISNVFFQVIFWYTKYRKHIISNIITS